MDRHPYRRFYDVGGALGPWPLALGPGTGDRGPGTGDRGNDHDFSLSLYDTSRRAISPSSETHDRSRARERERREPGNDHRRRGGHATTDSRAGDVTDPTDSDLSGRSGPGSTLRRGRDHHPRRRDDRRRHAGQTRRIETVGRCRSLRSGGREMGRDQGDDPFASSSSSYRIIDAAPPLGREYDEDRQGHLPHALEVERLADPARRGVVH